MSTFNKFRLVIAALFVALIGMAPTASFAQNEDGVTDQGESTKKVGGSYVNENGKFVCWPRLTSHGKLLTYGPLVDTEDPSDITSTSVTLHGNILHDGWCNGITGQGFEISLDADFSSIYRTVVTSPAPTFTPCDNFPTCTCSDNKYSEPVTGLTPGVTYYYRAYATNGCGTSYGDTVTFATPGAAFTVSVTPDAAVMFCPDATGSQNLTYTVSYSPSTIPSPTFQWYFDGTAVSGETGTTYTRTYTNSVGSHIVKCEVTSSGVTRDGSVTTAVSNYTVPSLAISGDASICAGATGNLTASTGFDIYGWSANVASSSTNTATYTAAGTYSVTASDSHGCSATATKTVEVNSPAISGTLSVSSQTICYGNNASLTASFSGTSTGTLSYQWYQGSTALSGQTSATLNLTAPTASGTYNCELTANVNGCTVSTTSSGTLTVNHPVANIASLTASPSSVCPGETSVLTATAGSTTGTLSYQWKQGSTNVGTNSTSYTTPALTANTTYSLTQTATVGSCTATDTKSVEVAVTTPSVTTYAVTGKTCVAGTFNANNSGCSDARGFVYSSTNTTPTCGGSDCTPVIDGTGTGNWSSSITDLTPDTKYYVQAWVNTNGTYTYGGVVNFTTDPITLTMSCQDDNINLCQLPHQVVVTMTAAPNCDESHINNYTWSLTPSDASATATYTQSSDGKSITVTVTSSTAVYVSATCTLHHTRGYTNSKTDYSTIGVYGDQPQICVCEDSYNGVVTLTNPAAAQIATIEWRQQGGAGYSTSTVGLNKNDPATPEGYYDVTITNTYGCQAARSVILGYPFDRCASLGTTGNTSENIDANGVWQITDSRHDNGTPTSTYRVVKIGSQCWMAENLRYKQSMDGSDVSIPRTDLVNVSIYNYPLYFTWPNPVTFTNGSQLSSTAMTARYGYLYTWIGALNAPSTASTRSIMYPEVVRDFHVQGVCPDGWHLPTDGEWFQLEHKLGVPRSDSATVTLTMRPETDGDDVEVASRGASAKAGAKAATGCEWWGYLQPVSNPMVGNSPEDLCNKVRDSIGFSAVPAGVFVPQEEGRADCFKATGGFANFWSATQGRSAHAGHDDFSDAAYARQLVADGPGWYRYRADKHNGMNVRCVRDMVTTANPTNVTTTSATVGGTVLEDAGYAITERGICWSNTGTPSISGSHRAVGSGVGAFTTTLTTSDIPSGEYQYCAYAINSEGVYYGLTKTVQILATPTVTTGTTSGITTSPSNSITLHGNLVADGGDPGTVRGICWGTSADPTLTDNVATASGSGTGEYSVTITPPSASTTYHYRAYATNSQGTSYGADLTFVLSACAGQTSIVIDGDTYTLHEVGSQCWTSNLHVTHYADGVDIPRGCPEHDQVGNNVYANLASPEADIEAYYYEPYNVNPGQHLSDWSARINSWGRLYNWAAATRRQSGNQVQGICPNGWHVPTYDDWNLLMSGRTPYDVCKPERWPENTTPGTPGKGVYDYNHGGYTGNSTHFSIDAAGYIIPGANDLSALNIAVNYWCGDKMTYPIDIWFQHDANVMGAQGAGDFRAFGFYVRCVKN